MIKKTTLWFISLIIWIAAFAGTSIGLFIHGERTGLKITGSLFSLGIIAVAYSFIELRIKKRKDASFKKTTAQKQNFIVGYAFIFVALMLNLLFFIW